ncbi:putative ribonuclease H protein [Trifolium medium]|uniref:Putative ribonuclease H protein n=1 Tax=Trifolium medium TaxID=97028 RepID=A0A392Q1Z8_9FABA|nr:putative ribonuclease H protein [Trifolium medium]
MSNWRKNSHCDPNSLVLTNIPQISQELFTLLLNPISEREVKDALFSMYPYKAPGPDGFQPVFFRNYWNIVAKDVWTSVSYYKLNHEWYHFFFHPGFKVE